MSDGPEITGGVPPDPDSLHVSGLPSAERPRTSGQSGPDDRSQPRHPLTHPETDSQEGYRVHASEIVVDEPTSISEEEAERFAEAIAPYASTLERPQQEALLTTAVTLKGKESLSEEDENKIVEGFMSANLKQEHFDALTVISALSPEAKERVKKRLDGMTPEEKKQEEGTPEETAQRITAMQAQGEQALQAGEVKLTELKAKGKDKEHSALEKKLHHLKEWLNPDDFTKTWARRAGKSLYVMFLAMIIMIIWEMSVINKAAGKAGGR